MKNALGDRSGGVYIFTFSFPNNNDGFRSATKSHHCLIAIMK